MDTGKANNYISNVLKYIETVHGPEELKKVNEDNFLSYAKEYNDAYKRTVTRFLNLSPDIKTKFIEILTSSVYTGIKKQKLIEDHNKIINHALNI